MKKIILSILFLMANSLAWASSPTPPVIKFPYTCVTNYYINASIGNDSNTQTQAQSPSTPWLTIQHSINVLQGISNFSPGVCVNVAAGTYTENDKITNLGGLGPWSTGWLVFKSTTLHGAVLVVPLANVGISDASNFNIVAGNYIVFDGFDMEGQNTLNGTPYAGSPFTGTLTVSGAQDNGIHNPGGNTTSDSQINHIVIINNILANHGACGVGVNHTDYMIIEGNTVFNNAFTSGPTNQESGISIYQAVASDASPGYHNIIAWNVMYNNMEINNGTSSHSDGNCLIIDDFLNDQGGQVEPPYTQESLIANNIGYSCGGAAFHFFFSDYLTVLNNTAYLGYLDTDISGQTYLGSMNAVQVSYSYFVNNIAYTNPNTNGGANPVYAFMEGGAFSNNTGNLWHNNLAFSDTGQHTVFFTMTDSVYTGNGDLNGVDPKFTSLVTPDFTLQAGSPAINAGTYVYGYPKFDMNGLTSSPFYMNMGAYQNGSVNNIYNNFQDTNVSLK